MSVYIDGEMLDNDNARLSVYDHGLLYGDGVFEGLRVYGGRVFKMREHLARLYEGARVLCLGIPLGIDEMDDAVRRTVAASGINDGYVRLLVTRGVGSLGVNPRSCPTPSVVIIADAIQLYPRECYEQGIDLIVASTRRMPPSALDARVKSLNYLNNVQARLEANRAGAHEALMLTTEGLVAECTGDNIFVVRDGALATPPTHIGVLRGITRDTVLELASDMGIPWSERCMMPFDVYTADEVFLTGTAAEVVPVRSVDGRAVGASVPGPITARLVSAYRELVSSQSPIVV